MDTVKKLFSANVSADKDSSTLATSSASTITNILDSFASTNNEGVDPANCQYFETSHPYPIQDKQRKQIYVPRALGYLIEVDSRSSIGNSHGSLHVCSTDYKQVINEDFGTYFEFK